MVTRGGLDARMTETTSDKPIALGPTPRLRTSPGGPATRWRVTFSVVVPPLYWLTRFVTANTVHS